MSHCPSRTVHESGATYCCTLPAEHEGMHQVSVTRFWGDAEGAGHPAPFVECLLPVAGDCCVRPIGHDDPCTATRLHPTP